MNKRTSSAEVPDAVTGLSEARIVRRARQLARTHGFARITMRMLGDEFNVSATALYYYFKNKDALFDAVSEEIFREIRIQDHERPWDERLRTYVLAYQACLLEYPGLAKLLLVNPDSEAGVSWTESIMSILHDAGLEGDDVWTAFGMLVFFVNPMTLLDESPTSSRANPYDPTRVKKKLANARSRYPTLARVVGPQSSTPTSMEYDDLLPRVLDRIIETIRSDPNRRQT